MAKRFLKKVFRRLRTERIVFRMPERAHCPYPPIFILGVHRSGTTLMRLIIDSHSRIACPLESMFILPLAHLWTDSLALKGLAGMGFPADHVKYKLREFIDYYFEVYASSRGKVRWADKCPHYIDCADFLEELYGPECGYIFMYRHGLDVACSVARMPIEPAQHHKDVTGDPYVGGARYWASQCEKLLAFQDRIGGRGITVHYEDLVTDPERVVRCVLRHVGEQWENQVLRFYELEHSRAPGLEDPKASYSRGFFPSLGSWQHLSQSVVRRMTAETLPMLERLGYAPDHPLPNTVLGAQGARGKWLLDGARESR